jgi:protein-tyrosine phosphatase
MDGSNYDDVVFMAKTEEDKNKVQLILDELFPAEPLYVKT